MAVKAATLNIRAFVGDRRMTIVFDRGGWSPRLFQKLITDGFDMLTYRKGRTRKRLRWEFREHRAVLDGRQVVYQLADHDIRLLGGKLELREVVRVLDDGCHQTQVVTSRRDLPAIGVRAYRGYFRRALVSGGRTRWPSVGHLATTTARNRVAARWPTTC